MAVAFKWTSRNLPCMVNPYSPMDCLQDTRVLLTTQWYLGYHSNDIRPFWTPLAFHNHHDSSLLAIAYRISRSTVAVSQPILIGLNPVYRYIVCYKFSLDWILSTGNVEHWKAQTFHGSESQVLWGCLFSLRCWVWAQRWKGMVQLRSSRKSWTNC